MTSSPRLRKLSQRCEPMKPAPPVMRTLAIFPPDRIADKPQLAEFLGIVDVAAVKNDRIFQLLFDVLEIWPAKLIPFGDDQQRIRAPQRVVIPPGIVDPIAEELLRFLDGLGIIGLNSRPRLKQGFHHDNGGSVPHVVRARLEREPPDREGAAGKVRPEVTLDLFNEDAFLLLIDLLYGSEEDHAAIRSSHSDHRTDIFGKTRTAVAHSWKNEMRPDPPV